LFQRQLRALEALMLRLWLVSCREHAKNVRQKTPSQETTPAPCVDGVQCKTVPLQTVPVWLTDTDHLTGMKNAPST
jgi:hypothetical protein